MTVPCWPSVSFPAGACKCLPAGGPAECFRFAVEHHTPSHVRVSGSGTFVITSMWCLLGPSSPLCPETGARGLDPAVAVPSVTRLSCPSEPLHLSRYVCSVARCICVGAMTGSLRELIQVGSRCHGKLVRAPRPGAGPRG